MSVYHLKIDFLGSAVEFAMVEHRPWVGLVRFADILGVEPQWIVNELVTRGWCNHIRRLDGMRMISQTAMNMAIMVGEDSPRQLAVWNWMRDEALPILDRIAGRATASTPD